jgi:hypothetical protein
VAPIRHADELICACLGSRRCLSYHTDSHDVCETACAGRTVAHEGRIGARKRPESPNCVAGCTQMKALCAPSVPRLNEVHVDKKVDLPCRDSRLRDYSLLGQPLHRLSVHNRDDTSKRFILLMGEMQRFGLEKLQISIGWVQALRQPEPHPCGVSTHRKIRVAGFEWLA